MAYLQTETTDLVEIGDLATANLHSHLRMFMIRVRDIFPLCSFAEVSRGIEDSERVYVYHKHKPLVMGWIGYGDFRNSGGGDTYVVNSRKVSNGKYNDGTRNFFTVMSADIKVAMRNVSKYLIDYGPAELALIYSRDAHKLWGATCDSLTDDLRAAQSEITPSPYSREGISPLEAELQILVDAGYKFINPQFGECVNKFLSAREEFTGEVRRRSSTLAMVSVELSPVSGNTLFVVARIDDINSSNPALGPAGSWVPKGTFVEDTLDRDIMGKLATLQMCEIGHWVDGVGYRPMDTLFYVVQ